MKIDRTIIDFLRKKKECDDVILHYRLEDSNLTRFAENRITQNISQKNFIKIKLLEKLLNYKEELII